MTYKVRIHNAGKSVRELRHVRSIMEISDEETESISGLALHHKGTWINVMNDDFEQITIQKDKQDAPKELHR